MAFHDREYDVYVVLGSPAVRPPWVQPTWNGVSEALDPVMGSARERPSVRSTQLGPKPGSPNQRSISFGRIGWNDRGAKKWTHSEDGQLVSGRLAHFLTCEIWAPSWTACARDHLAPDVYFVMSNASELGHSPKSNSALKFNSHCILAVASDMGSTILEQARGSAQSIALLLRAVLQGYCVRPWGRSYGGGFSYTDAINDLAIVGLFKLGPRHKEPVSLSMLSGTWASF